MGHIVWKKTALAVVSVLLMLSMGGGFLLLPILIPLHIWAALRSGSAGRVLWSFLPVAAVGMATWAAVYVTIGEVKPWIWLAPVAVAAGAVLAMVRLTAPDVGVTANPSPV